MTPREAAEVLVDAVAVGATAADVLELLAAPGVAYEAVEEAVRQQRGTTLNLAWDLSYLESRALRALHPLHPMLQLLPKDSEDYRATQAEALAVARQAAYIVGLVVGRRLDAKALPEGGER